MLFERFALVVLGAGLCCGGATADPLSSIVVYGDSLSDNGNLYAATHIPGPPYYMGRRSNGPLAVEQMASSLGIPLFDYAWIGATSGIGNYGDLGTPTSLGAAKLPGMLTEFNNTQGLVSLNAGALFVVWGGANDFLSPSPMDKTPQQQIARAVGDIVTIVDGLQSRGATHILVPGMPDLGLTPDYRSLGPLAAGQATALTDAFNIALIASLPAGAEYVDTAGLLRAIVADPQAYGLSNATDACYDEVSTVCSDPSQYLFFDGFHPTTQADAIVAQTFLQATEVPEPCTEFSMISGLVLLVTLGRNGSKSRTRFRSLLRLVRNSSMAQ